MDWLGGNLIYFRGYSYDANGNIGSGRGFDSNIAESHEYDALDRVIANYVGVFPETPSASAPSWNRPVPGRFFRSLGKKGGMVENIITHIFTSFRILNKPVKITLMILVWIAIMILVHFLMNPLSRPEASVRNYILRITPLGTDMEDVIAIVENRAGWEVRLINHTSGFIHQGPRIPGWPTDERGRTVIGEKSIKVEGSYRAFYRYFLESVVNINWGFDANGKLVEVTVSKYISI